MTKVLASGLDRVVHPINETRTTILNQPSPEQLALPFYNLLPKDPIELLRWKIYAHERCLTDLEFRDAIMEACAQDVCFFASTFGFVFEPRPPRGIPWTLWCDQADVLAWMAECYETHRDLGGEKSRGIGLSWDVALLAYWLWLFVPDVKIALTTKDETTLDGPDSNTLMGKIAYIHSKMPAWARTTATGKDSMHRTYDQHLMVNRVLGGTIQGFAPTNDKLRSLRFSIVIYDEFAYFPREAQETLNASVHTAPCRIFISTWHGHDNAFHQIMRAEKSTLLRIQSYWYANAERWKGAYTTESGRLKILDSTYDYPVDYPFVLDGMLRSPWVDFELRRAGSSKQSALEELYGLAAETGRKLLRADTIKIVESTVLPCHTEGELDYTGAESVFRPVHNGSIKLWAPLGNGRGGPFAAGCDLAHGLGATPSTLEVIDMSGGLQVAEFADNSIAPVDFAAFVVAFLRWLAGDKGDGHCFLDFEANGEQAISFGNELLRLGYGNIRERKLRRPVDGRATYLGTRNRDGGRAIIDELQRAILDSECTVRSHAVLAEMRVADKDDKGRPTFHGIENSHGDRLQGLAIAWGLAKDRLLEPATGEAEMHTIEYLRAHALDEIKNPTPAGRQSFRDAWSFKRDAA